MIAGTRKQWIFREVKKSKNAQLDKQNNVRTCVSKFVLVLDKFLSISSAPPCSSLLLSAPELLRSRSGAAPPFLPSNLVTLCVLLRSSSSLAPLTMNFRRRKGAAPEPDEEQPP